MDISSQLPAFTERAFGEILEREDLILDKADQILNELDKMREFLDPTTAIVASATSPKLSWDFGGILAS